MQNRIKKIENKLDKINKQKFVSFETLFSKQYQEKLKREMFKSLQLIKERNLLLSRI